MQSTKTCPTCGRAFIANYEGRECCSQACRDQHIGSWIERFWRRTHEGSKQHRGTNCLEWTGRVEENGYARIRRENSRERVLVHRLAWELLVGPVPAGLFVLHHCDNRICVNVVHLFTGTARDNSQDMLQKGRANKVRGAKHGRATLTEEQAAKIIKYHATGDFSYAELGEKYGVSKVEAYRIVNGLKWAHLPRPAAEERVAKKEGLPPCGGSPSSCSTD